MSNRLGWRDLRATPAQRGRVLVVDDELDLRRVLQKLITGLGYTVRAAGSAEEADVFLTAERFDVCLLDIELPRMKGVEFLAWALKRDPEMAVIMLTGLDAPELAIECIKAGARTYLVKPVSADFLRLAVHDAVAVRRVLVERNDLASG
ncbi:MAG: response regulator, partial [Longimicrobiales bacterium]|nr:response regulator [Longimicrobiales bacterium]